MMRALRRQLRAWKQEFLQFWGRLRSFHRVSLGIILAFAMMSAAQRYGFSVLKREIAEEKETQQKQEVPDLVTRPEDDPETQELQLRLENIEQTIGSHRAKRQKAVAAWPRFTKADQGTILAKFNDLVSQAGLTTETMHDAASKPPEAEDKGTRQGSRVQKPPAEKPKAPEKKSNDSAEKPKAKEPLDSVVYCCVLAGSFSEVRKFLQEVDKFEYPARLEKIRLELTETASDEGEQTPWLRPNAAPVIRLSFDLRLYFYE